MAVKVIVMNANLFALAAKYYNDATQWVVIARANGINDPFVLGQRTLVIPTNVQATGGLPLQ